jgi:hypothetical protein
VPFGNPATLSQSFFVRQSINEVKASVTVPVYDIGEAIEHYWTPSLRSSIFGPR